MKKFKSKRMFESSSLEMLTRVHPGIAIIYNVTTNLSLLYINYHFGFVTGVGKIAGLFFLGCISWSIAEYLLHRFFFHIRSEKHPILSKISHTVHGVHHEQPTDYKRMFMPPVPATLFMVFFFVIFYFIMSTAVYVFLPGFLTGYLGYAFTHFKIHQSKAPKKLKWLWTHHIKHHYQDDKKAFGVSSPLWDLVFRTMPSKLAIKASKEMKEKEPSLINDEEEKN